MRCIHHLIRVFGLAATQAVLIASGASAGPPYLSDDPEPTEYEHYEIFVFGNGEVGNGGSSGEAGIDFNYGATPDLQLTAVLPLGYASPNGNASTVNLGNIELAAKYRFLRQTDFGWDVSMFPRIFLPAGSAQVGARHASFLLPLWFEKDWGTNWTTFGGGGCVLNRSGDSRNFCMLGWAVTHQLLPGLQLGAEVFHQTADTKNGHTATTVGVGARYDLNDQYHLLGFIGPTAQNGAQTGYTWYGSVLLTF